MGMTMTQKILAAHAGLDKVIPGQLINAKLDLVLGNDITTPVAVREFNKSGFSDVFDKDRIAIVLDHFVPNKDIKAAEQSKTCRDFACCHGVSHFYDVGKMGIEHALLPEQGVVTAGDCIVSAFTRHARRNAPSSSSGSRRFSTCAYRRVKAGRFTRT